MVVGSVVAAGLALLAILFAAILLISGWHALRGELLPGFRIDPPRPRSVGLAVLGVLLPILLIAAFTAYLAAWLLGTLIAVR